MKQLYVGGDSYCFYREDPSLHWPSRLAEHLGLELVGQGYPGQSWWPTRRHLVEYPDLDQVELFVFCHTDPERVLSDREFFSYSNPERDQATEAWFKYIQSPAISMWTADCWYRELNQLLTGRRVLHLRSFDCVDLSSLEGTCVTTPLLKLAVESAGGNYYGDWSAVGQLINEYPNHLSPEYNCRLADFLAGIDRSTQRVQFL